MRESDINPNTLDEEAIFKVACRITAAEARDEYLRQICGDDPALSARVARLLHVYHQQPSFLEHAGTDVAGNLDLSPSPCRIGSTIGHYKIREKLAEGGMGVVYVAEQTEPVRRKVALKIIKPGMATKEVLARFEAERQALAMMEHPHIARMIDAGTTQAGEPFFVMELVYGVPITEYCDQNELTNRERLQLFEEVCRAIQHAHQKGVIHRDIKPSNVLVAAIDGAAVPKVIDFGVAKAVGQTLVDETIYTQFSQIVGTPLYMSPEQANLGVTDVDTRSDVYSLGVLLYELLSGGTPFHPEALKQAGFDEMRRIIREDEPPRPSALVSTLQAQALSTISARRHIDPRKLGDFLRGELDWIIMKALDKDRDRRYESASAFAADVELFLHGDAVQACPPSKIYRFRKFARRYGSALATASVLVLVLIIGIVGTTWQMLRAISAEREASAQTEYATLATQRADEEAKRAIAEAAISKAINDFVNNDLLAQADPTRSQVPDPNVRLRDVLDRAAAGVPARFQEHPLVEAAIHFTLGETYASLGAYPEAVKHHERSLAIRRRDLGNEHVDTLKSLAAIADIALQEAPYFDAEKQFRQVLAIRQRVLGDEHPDTLTSMGGVASAAFMQGRYAHAEQLHRQVLEIRRRVLGEEHEDTLDSMQSVAASLWGLGKYTEAEVCLRESLEVAQRTLGLEHPFALHIKQDLASVLTAQIGQDVEAASISWEVMEANRRVLGEMHPDTISSMHSVAAIMVIQGRYSEAETLYREVLELSESSLGTEHARTLDAMSGLAEVLAKLRRYEQAETLFRETLQLRQRILGEGHPLTLQDKHNLSGLLRSLKRYAEAESIESDVLELVRRVLGDEHPNTLRTMATVACAIADQGRYIEASERLREVLKVRQRVLGADHQDMAIDIQSLTNLLILQSWELSTSEDKTERNPVKAVEDAREATTLRPDLADTWNHLGVALCSAGQWQGSVEAFEKAESMIVGGDREHRMFLAMSHWQLGHHDVARQRYVEGAIWIAVNRKNHAEQYRFREEAERLLGLSEQDRHELIAEYCRLADMSDAKAVIEAAQWYQLMGNHSKAIEYFTSAIELDPASTSVVPWRSRGICYFAIEQDQKALVDFGKAIELQADDVWSITMRATSYFRLGELDLALRDRNKVIELEPSTNHRFFERAEVYRALGKFDLALADIKQGFETDAIKDAAWFPRSRAYALCGDIYADNLQHFDEAITEYTHAIELDPDNSTYSEKREAAVQARDQGSYAPSATEERLPTKQP